MPSMPASQPGSCACQYAKVWVSRKLLPPQQVEQLHLACSKSCGPQREMYNSTGEFKIPHQAPSQIRISCLLAGARHLASRLCSPVSGFVCAGVCCSLVCPTPSSWVHLLVLHFGPAQSVPNHDAQVSWGSIVMPN